MDSKVIPMVGIAHFYVNAIGKHSAKYEHPWSKNEKAIRHILVCDIEF